MVQNTKAVSNKARYPFQMPNQSTLAKPAQAVQAKNSNSIRRSNPMNSPASVNSAHASHFQPAAATQRDDLARVFNTAVVSSQAKQKRDFSSELYELTESASFKAILNTVRQLSRVQGISERQASEHIIQTFRKMDDIWGGYVSHEGLEKLRSPGSK